MLVAKPITDYHDCRDELLDGDVVLYMNGGLIGRIDDFTHAELVTWHRDENGKKTICEVTGFREFQGARTVTLSSQVRKYPGAIHIFRPRCDARTAKKAADLLRSQAGKRYGWLIILIALAWHCMGLRFVTRWRPAGNRDTAPSKWDAWKVCSSSVIWAFRIAMGFARKAEWPCPFKADWMCYPQHVAEDSFFQETPWKGLVIDD